MRLFLFGTLLWPDLLTRVAGRPVAMVPATLAGHRIERAADGDWPVLVEGGEIVHGALTEPLPPDILDRIDWYEGGYDCARHAVAVEAPDGLVEAGVYRAASGGAGPWTLDAWRADHGARTLRAADEIMRAMGREDPAALARRRATIHGRAGAWLDAHARSRPATHGGDLTRADLGPVEATPIHDGFNLLTSLRLAFPHFDGSTSAPVEREVTVAGHAATVLPYDPVRDRVLLIEQFRAGPLAQGDPQPWLLEPVAGLIDAGEDAPAAAIRETREEAGLDLSPDALHLVARYYPTPGAVAQVLWSYVALCDLPDGIDGTGGVAHEAEDIRSHLVPFADLMEMLASGEAANAPLILTAQWLALNRDRLRGDS